MKNITLIKDIINGYNIEYNEEADKFEVPGLVKNGSLAVVKSAIKYYVKHKSHLNQLDHVRMQGGNATMILLGAYQDEYAFVWNGENIICVPRMIAKNLRIVASDNSNIEEFDELSHLYAKRKQLELQIAELEQLFPLAIHNM